MHEKQKTERTLRWSRIRFWLRRVTQNTLRQSSDTTTWCSSSSSLSLSLSLSLALPCPDTAKNSIELKRKQVMSFVINLRLLTFPNLCLLPFNTFRRRSGEVVLWCSSSILTCKRNEVYRLLLLIDFLIPEIVSGWARASSLRFPFLTWRGDPSMLLSNETVNRIIILNPSLLSRTD